MEASVIDTHTGLQRSQRIDLCRTGRGARLVNFLLATLLSAIAKNFYRPEVEMISRRLRDLLEGNPITDEYDNVILALIEAEDHRFALHYGVDTLSIVRAIVATLVTRQPQGGSTITQQLVRVITSDYRKTASRKVREMCFAAWVDARFSKHEQAVSYLNIAYFGWRMNGYREAAARLQLNTPCNPSEAAALVARLKYPEPQWPAEERLQKIKERQAHIVRRTETRVT